MIKLICDIRCGYDKLYMVEKDAEFPLDFLTNEAVMQSAMQWRKEKNKQPILTEDELLTKYMKEPEKLVQDYNLFGIIRSLLSTEYYYKYFFAVKDPNHPFFPEYFRVENCRLAYSREKPKQNNMSDEELEEFLNTFTGLDSDSSQDLEDNSNPNITNDTKKGYDA